MHRLLQLTLDFFDSAPATPPQEPTARKRRSPDTTTRPPAISQPTELLDQVLLPVAFRHPRANREAVLGDSVVAFEFRRGKRRNIGFMVGPEGLTVSAPKWVPLYEIDAAVKSKEPWILKKLGDARMTCCQRQKLSQIITSLHPFTLLALRGDT